MSDTLSNLFRKLGRVVTLEQLITDCRYLVTEIQDLRKENKVLSDRIKVLEESL